MTFQSGVIHFRSGDTPLGSLLQTGRVLAHPWVTGELALGNLSRRSEILGLLGNLPHAKPATETEVLTLIDSRRLFGLGIGYVDAHLLVATMLTTDARLWTRDKRLAAVAAQLGLVNTNAQSSSPETPASRSRRSYSRGEDGDLDPR